jgi:putative DNA primase/helicase
MADFAMWATAAEPLLGWREGAFLRAYTRNQASSNELALDASPITEPVRRLVAQNDFQGTATELLQVLTERSDDPTRRQKGWPANAQGLSNTLRRLAPNLRKIGIEVVFSKGKDRRRLRLIVLRDIASTSSDASGNPGPQ